MVCYLGSKIHPEFACLQQSIWREREDFKPTLQVVRFVFIPQCVIVVIPRSFYWFKAAQATCH